MQARELLTLWEEGSAATPLERTLLLLRAHLDSPPEAIRQLTLGDKESELLRLRADLFGRTMESLAECPSCAERLEFTVSTADLILDVSGSRVPTASLHFDTLELEVQPLTLEDLVLAEGDGRALFERAIISARKDGTVISASFLPQAVMEAVTDRLLDLDPLMRIRFQLTCPQCDHVWSAAFDPLTFLWTEIGHWAHSMLHTVHRLASQYGWSEDAILAMSAWRRQHYLELIQS